MSPPKVEKAGGWFSRRGLREWDAVLAFIAGIVMCFALISSSRPLEEAGGYLAAGAALVAATATGAFVASRWVGDLLSKDEYGEIIAISDPDGSQVRRPYSIVVVTGYLSALLGIFLIVTQEEFSRIPTAVLYSLFFAGVIYGILGSLSLWAITTGHQRRASRMRALKAKNERRQRGY